MSTTMRQAVKDWINGHPDRDKLLRLIAILGEDAASVLYAQHKHDKGGTMPPTTYNAQDAKEAERLKQAMKSLSEAEQDAVWEVYQSDVRHGFPRALGMVAGLKVAQKAARAKAAAIPEVSGVLRASRDLVDALSLAQAAVGDAAVTAALRQLAGPQVETKAKAQPRDPIASAVQGFASGHSGPVDMRG